MQNTQEKPLYFYVANLGSEIQRVLGWKEKGDKEAMQNAYQRAIGIIATIRNFGNANASAEMNMLESALCHITENNENLTVEKKELSIYFYPFALRVAQESLK